MRLVLEKSSQLPNFNNNVKKGPWLVWFYADWCGHCNMMKPEWKKLEKRCASDPRLNVAKVRDDMKDNIPEQMNQNIQGFPTVRMFNNGKMMSEYSGERNNNAFLEFLLNKIKNVRSSAVKKSVKKINNNILNSMRKKTNRFGKKNSGKKNSGKNSGKKNSGKKNSGKKNSGKKTMRKKRPRVARAAGGFIRDKSVQQFRIRSGEN